MNRGIRSLCAPCLGPAEEDPLVASQTVDYGCRLSMQRGMVGIERQLAEGIRKANAKSPTIV